MGPASRWRPSGVRTAFSFAVALAPCKAGSLSR
nr:MAG TPA: hypothetical protein [Microviridae sp.]